VGNEENRVIVEHWNQELWCKNNSKSIELTTKLYGYKDTRITFVKCKDGYYYFLGVFKFDELDDIEKIKKYKLISTSYPIFEN